MKIGKYEIEEELGRGSMGVVYRARDPLLDRYVALKLISTEALDDMSRQLFEREAKAVARMSHPNIVVVYEFDYFEKQPYIAMELLKGSSLEDTVLENPLKLSLSLSVVHQVLSGLQHAHEQGVVHRDIKPTNILLTESNLVKIMDFGIARLAASASTATEGFVLGTPEFMSPEQVKAETLDGRTDIFSVGSLLYWLFTNHTPFDADTAEQVMVKIVNDEPEQLQVKGVSIRLQKALQLILNRALAKDPMERYSTAGAMADEIKALITLLEEQPHLEDEDEELEMADTMQLSVPKFATVRKTAQIKPPVVTETKPQEEEPPPIEKTIPLADILPEVLSQPAPVSEKKEEKKVEQEPVMVPPMEPSRRLSGLHIAIALIILLVGAWGAYRAIFSTKKPPARAIVPASSPIELSVACSTEKLRWTQHVLDKFAQTPAGRNIRMNLNTEPSALETDSIFQEQKHYQVWWPPSTLETSVVKQESRKLLGGDHQSVVLNPMVFIMWKERYEAFVKRYKTVNFETISQALMQDSGWNGISKRPDWGSFSFGFADPDKTNSGSLMLLLLTHEYLTKTSSLNMDDVQNPDLKKFLTDLKKKTTSKSNSAKDVMEEMIRKGPSTYSIAFVYENLAMEYLKDAKNRWGDYQVVYPIYNYWNENPLYVLDSEWSSPEQKKASEIFLQYLTGEVVQRDSLQYGFRPTLTSVAVQIPGSPFVDLQNLGFRADIGAVVQDPTPEAFQALKDLWRSL